jgi:single-strand DNA-binding protein
MNNVTMTGRLTRDPELHQGAERSECKLRLAVDNGIYPPTFIDVRTFGPSAEACAEWLTKGWQVGVSGKLALTEFTGSDGKPRQRYSVIGRVEFLGRPRPGVPETGGRPEEPEPIGSAQPEPALAV